MYGDEDFPSHENRIDNIMTFSLFGAGLQNGIALFIDITLRKRKQLLRFSLYKNILF